MNQQRSYLKLADASTIIEDDSCPVVAMGIMVKGHETKQDIATFQLLVNAYNAINMAARIHAVDASEMAQFIHRNPHLLKRVVDLMRPEPTDC